MCRHACPVALAEGSEAVTPGHKMAVLDLARRGLLPVDDVVGRLWLSCTACGACSRFCLYGNDVAAALVEARRALVASGAFPLAEKLARRVRESGNPTGADLARLQRERLPPRPERGRVLYFPGCTALTRLPEHAADTLLALERSAAGTVAVAPVATDAGCCGYSLWAAGLWDLFVENGRRVAAHLAGRGTVLCSDPGCAYTLGHLYPAMGIEPRLTVRHTAEWLASSPELLGRAPAGTRSLYHDPCHLGRRLGVYDAPREALTRADGAPPLEPTWSREKAECCGAGALYAVTRPEGARRVATRRLRHEVDELKRTGATRVVTACPSCEVQLAKAGVPVWDLARAVLGALEPAARA
jgi:Fe-S oxidoreductase